jgi:hypothetical protein
MKWLKRQIARWAAADELAELDRWRSTTDEYWRWLAEFYPICLTLENLRETAQGNRPLNISRPRGGRRPFDVVNLRDELRDL